MSSTETFVKDELLSAACDAQRTRGEMPTVADNERYLTDVLERFDNKPKQQLAPRTEPRKKDVNRIREEAKRRGYDIAGEFDVTERSGAPLALGGSIFQVTKDSPLKHRLRMRLRLIRSKPDWAARLKRVNPLALQGKVGKTPEERHALREGAANEVRRILEASNAVWGDWWKPPKSGPLYSYAGQVKR